MSDTKLNQDLTQLFTIAQAQSTCPEVPAIVPDTSLPAQPDDQNDQFEEDCRLAAYFASPSYQAASVITSLTKDGVDTEALMAVLLDRAEQLQSGDLTSILELLSGQAAMLLQMSSNMTLRMTDAMFTGQTEKMALYGNLSLKTNSLLLKVATTIANIQKPRQATYIGQMNTALNQQVVNGDQPERLENYKNPASRLLDSSEEQHDE